MSLLNKAKSTPDDMGLHIWGGHAPSAMACIVKAETGYCGEGNCEVVIIWPNTDLDALAEEMAQENAQSFGSEGECVCSGCGAEDGNDGDFCEEEGCNGVYVYSENENICAIIYKIQPSVSMDYVNGGSDWMQVFEAMEEHNIITLSEDKKKVLIYRSAMEQFLYLPNSYEWDILLHEMIIYYSLNSVEYA